MSDEIVEPSLENRRRTNMQIHAFDVSARQPLVSGHSYRSGLPGHKDELSANGWRMVESGDGQLGVLVQEKKGYTTA